MERFVPALSLSFLLLLNICVNAQENKTKDDSTAVRTTVTNYIEAYYAGDAGRMKQTLHPHYLKHVIHGNTPMREKIGVEMVRDVRSHNPGDIPQSERTEQVTVLDVSGGIASAKLVTPGWVDYLTLSKTNGEWKILSVVQQIED